MKSSVGRSLANLNKVAGSGRRIDGVLAGRIKSLTDLPNLNEPFRRALEIKSRTTTHSALPMLQDLNRGVCDYLRSAGLAETKLSDFDRNMIINIANYIDKSRNAYSGKPLSGTTKSIRLARFRDACTILRFDDEWRSEAGRVASLFAGINPWPFSEREVNETQRLSLPDLIRIQTVCEDHCVGVRTELQTDLLARAKAGAAAIEKYGRGVGRRNLDACLHMCLKAFPEGVIPELSVIRQNDYSLYSAIVRHRRSEVDKFFYATGITLVPFIVLFVVALNANIETVAQLSFSDVTLYERLGKEFTTVIGKKGRAKKGQIFTVQNSSALRVNIPQLLETLRLYTERLRIICEPEDRDLIFLFFNARDQKVCTLRQTETSGSSIKIRRWLATFCKTHGLPPFNWRPLRKTLVDEGFQQTGSIAAASTLAHHKSVDTTVISYLSDASKSKLRESLGVALHAKDRMVRSKAADPRLRSHRQSKLAATHGFGCLDPYDSPYASGRDSLCDAYGRCPACPHHTFDVTILENIAAYQALSARVLEAGLANPASWREVWKPVHDGLSAILASSDPDLRERAEQITFPMLPVD